MANICDFEMKIVGEKKNREEFVRRLNDYEAPHHFWRTTAQVEEELETDTTTVVCGECAWSVAACGQAGGYSDEDLFAINTKELSLKVEIFSEEPNECFTEHYLYDNGEQVTGKSTSYDEDDEEFYSPWEFTI